MFSIVKNLKPNWTEPSGFRGKTPGLSQECQLSSRAELCASANWDPVCSAGKSGAELKTPQSLSSLLPASPIHNAHSPKPPPLGQQGACTRALPLQASLRPLPLPHCSRGIYCLTNVCTHSLPAALPEQEVPHRQHFFPFGHRPALNPLSYASQGLLSLNSTSFPSWGQGGARGRRFYFNT